MCLTLSNLYLLFCLNNISVKFVVFIAIYKVKNEIHEMQNVSSLSSSKMKSKFVTFANVFAKKHLVMHKCISEIEKMQKKKLKKHICL